MGFSNVFQAIKSFVLKSRPAYKDYVGEITSETICVEFRWNEDGRHYQINSKRSQLVIGDTYRIEFIDQNGNTSECTSIANEAVFVDIPVSCLALHNGDKTAYFNEICGEEYFITDDLAVTDVPDSMYYIADSIIIHHITTTKKYDIKKLPEECIPDSVTKKISKTQSIANTADSKANEARRIADEAQNRADGAHDIAYAADSKADNAKSIANTAKSTADAAKSTADAAQSIGQEWIQSSNNGLDFRNIVYGNGIWVGGTTSGIRYSFDGKKWYISTTTGINNIVYHSGIFVAGEAFNGSSLDYLKYSRDGMHWKNADTPRSRYSIKVCNNRWFAWNNSKMLYSDDGISWIESMTEDIYDVTYMDGIYVASGELGFYYSSDGAIWNKAEYSDHGDNDYELTYSNGVCVAVPYSIIDETFNKIAYTTDGKTWASSNLAIAGNAINVNGMWFVINSYAKIDLYYSIDGKTWIKTNIPSYTTSYSTKAIAYHNGIYVAVGNGIRYSEDGINWSVSNMGFNDSFNTIVCVDNMLIAVGNYGIAYSIDGKVWEIAIMPTDASNRFSDVVYANGMLQAIYYGTWGTAYSERMFVRTDDMNFNINWIKNQIDTLYTDGYTLPKDGNPGDILVKTDTGSEWQKQEPATSTPDWNQNDSTASDYIKNRPCFAFTSTHYKIVQSGTVNSSSISVSNSNNIASYDAAMNYKSDTKGEFLLIIRGSSPELIYDGNLTFIGDESGTRRYGDGEKVELRKSVANDQAYLYFMDSSLVDISYTYILQINDPDLIYNKLDDGYIPDTVQRVGGDVIINSSTPDSTKKFKITVDDTGTISATEVT